MSSKEQIMECAQETRAPEIRTGDRISPRVTHMEVNL